MKQKTTIFKTIALAAAMMLGGTGSMWAQTTLYYRTQTGTESDPADAAEQAWSASDLGTGKWVANGNATVTGDNTNGLKVTTNGDAAKIATATYSNLITPTDDYILNFSIVWNTGVNPYNYTSYNSLQIGNNITIYNVQEGSGTDNLGSVIPEKKSCVKIGSEFFYLTNAKDKDNNITERVQEDIWTINIQINLITNKIVSLTLTGSKNQESGDGDTKVNLTKSNLSLPDGTTFNDWILTGRCGAKAGTSGSVWTALQSVKLTETEPAKYGYYVKYCTNPSNVAGTTVKIVDMTAAANKVYNLKTVNADVTAFTESATKYYIADDATTSFQITEDNQVCVVKVREAYSVDWELRGKCGELDLGPISSGTQTEGETVDTYYKRFLLKNGTLYGLASGKGSKKDYFKHGFTINEGSEDDQIEYLDYTAEVNNVVALTEIEDVVDVVSNNYVGERSSGGVASYTSDYVTIASGLPSGQYKLLARATSGSSSRTLTFKCGSTTLYNPTMTTSAGTLSDYVSDWFELTGASNTIEGIVESGTNSRMDYVYVQRRCETISDCDDLGYTFSSTLPLDFTDTSVRAYIATYDKSAYGDVVKLTNVKKVPANTGVLIFSNSALSNQSIPVTTESTDDVTGNKLVAVNSAMTLSAAPEGYENYVLTIEGGKPVFQLVKTNSASMSAGQAYLQIPKRTGEGARSLRIVFDDETTGVADVRGKMEDVRGDFFNLQGQRVDTPKKGLYIVNGKKVIVK